MSLGCVTIGPKTYEIKRRRFTVRLSNGEYVGVGGELALLLGRVLQGDQLYAWKDKALWTFREALHEGFVNCDEGELFLSERGKEALRKFLAAQRREERRAEKRRKKVSGIKRALLKLLKRKKLTVLDVSSGVKFERVWVKIDLSGEEDFRAELYAWVVFSLDPYVESFEFSVDSIWFRTSHGKLFRHTAEFLTSNAVIKTLSLVDEHVKILYEICRRDSKTDT